MYVELLQIINVKFSVENCQWGKDKQKPMLIRASEKWALNIVLVNW